MDLYRLPTCVSWVTFLFTPCLDYLLKFLLMLRTHSKVLGLASGNTSEKHFAYDWEDKPGKIFIRQSGYISWPQVIFILGTTPILYPLTMLYLTRYIKYHSIFLVRMMWGREEITYVRPRPGDWEPLRLSAPAPLAPPKPQVHSNREHQGNPRLPRSIQAGPWVGFLKHKPPSWIRRVRYY